MENIGANTDNLREQAESWFVRVRAGACSAVELGEFDAWVHAASAHAQAFTQTQQLWDALGLLADDPEVAQWRVQARAAMRRSRIGTVRRWVLGAVAAGTAAVAVGLWLVPLLTQAPMRYYETARGEQSRFTLDDGTHLALNTDTRLGVRLDGRRREVELVRGEALFEVVHDAARPFRVLVADAVVTDLGTTFNIHSERGITRVTLIEGSAEVTRVRNKQAATLAAGEQLLATTTTFDKSKTADLSEITGWSNGRWVFRATPLREVVAQVNRYGPGRLAISDATLGDLRISGDFRIGNTEALVRALQSAFPVRAEAVGDETLLRRR